MQRISDIFVMFFWLLVSFRVLFLLVLSKAFIVLSLSLFFDFDFVLSVLASTFSLQGRLGRGIRGLTCDLVATFCQYAMRRRGEIRVSRMSL